MSPHRFEAENKGRLKSEERKRVQPAAGIIERASPTLDEVCADLGCGNGYVSIPFSIRCKVLLAVDGQREMIDDLLRSAGEFERLKIMPVVADMSRLPFSGASLDRVLLINAFHEVDDRYALAAEAERVLRPGGKITLVDFQKRPTSLGPPVEERIREADIPKHFTSMVVDRKWSFEDFYHFELLRR
jgi:ubiquinone/menaquinone biosynthesis C-methylase UbiE